MVCGLRPVSHFRVHRPVRRVVGDPGVTGKAALHDGIVVLVLLAVLQETAGKQMHTQHYCISAADRSS